MMTWPSNLSLLLGGIKSILAHQCVPCALSLCPSRPGWAVQADGPRPPSPAVEGKESDDRKHHLQAGGTGAGLFSGK